METPGISVTWQSWGILSSKAETFAIVALVLGLQNRGYYKKHKGHEGGRWWNINEVKDLQWKLSLFFSLVCNWGWRDSHIIGITGRLVTKEANLWCLRVFFCLVQSNHLGVLCTLQQLTRVYKFHDEIFFVIRRLRKTI